eukprot:1714910-Prymnesium_polylepis.1
MTSGGTSRRMQPSSAIWPSASGARDGRRQEMHPSKPRVCAVDRDFYIQSQFDLPDQYFPN